VQRIDGAARRPAPARRPIGPTRREVLQGVTAELRQAGLESPGLEAGRLIAAELGITRSRLTVDGSERVSPAEAARVARAVARRLQGEPLQHIEGSVEFRRLVLVSDPRALIPRPETEQLVDLIVNQVRVEGPVGRALEVGVGSGAIALSLIAENLANFVIGLDVSSLALEQARENAAEAGVGTRLELRRCDVDFWSCLTGEARFDLLVANLPYIATDRIEGLQREVRDHDPRVSLDGGEDGLVLIRRLIRGAPGVLVRGARIFLEIGADKGPAVMALLEDGACWDDARIAPDLTGTPRFATARFAGVPPAPS